MKKPHNNKKKRKNGNKKKQLVNDASTNNGTSSLYNEALEYKNEGNAFFQKAQYERAVELYTKGIHVLENNSNNNNNADSSDDNKALQTTLYSNRAQVFIKLGEFAKAEADCNFVLLQQGPLLDNSNIMGGHKIWYRRALAREGLAKSCDNPREMLLKAKADLQTCLSIQNDENLKRTVALIALRLQGSLHTMEHDKLEQERLSKLPLKESQKESVLKLLQLNSCQSNDAAFFLLDWNWWSHWVNYVGLFDSCDNNNDTSIPGLPPETKPPAPMRLLGPPGIIDNSRLLKQQSRFHQHWYGRFELRPNLIRGYDYEIVPREVYNALRLWYQEGTTPICRRVVRGKLILYETTSSHDDTGSTPAAFGKCGNCGAPQATKKCRSCQQVFYCNRECQERHWKLHRQQCGKKSAALLSPKMDVGLNNLGNTCFMNSALQCLAHATPLTRYFLSGNFKMDLNPQNPLGTGGKLAIAYEDVVRNLQLSSNRSYSPTALKRAIAMFAPRFAGCLQHDAQEFLAYLLDGLHEDLNRIQNPPYIETPDVEGCLHIAGRENWITHQKRNDSLVLDTFYGQFKSTCVCPQCEQVSVSFDAFNHISLELPQKNAVVVVPVLLFRGPDAPVRYGIPLRKSNHVQDLKAAIMQHTGIEVQRQVVCEIDETGIQEEYVFSRQISELPSQLVAVYDVDSLDDTNYCHVVASHRLVRGKAEHPFGLPFLTSFPNKYSCRQIWEHIWDTVKRMVDESAQSHLQIRLVTRNGRPYDAFPDTDDKEHKGDTTVEISKSSLLPRDSDEPVTTFLEETSLRCIFVVLEWNDVPDEESKSEHLIDPERFLACADHESWIEFEKSRTTNGNNDTTLIQCFETFTNPERLDENNKWYCSRCKEHVCAMKTMELWKLPNVLIVHLKRFEFKHALRRDKLDTLVEFPLEGLDMSAHCSSHSQSRFVDDSVPAIYDCFAVVNHFGRMGFGHYTAFARPWDETTIAEEWSLFDDSSVRPATNASVVSPAAYVLFYRRRDFN